MDSIRQECPVVTEGVPGVVFVHFDPLGTLAVLEVLPGHEDVGRQNRPARRENLADLGRGLSVRQQGRLARRVNDDDDLAAETIRNDADRRHVLAAPFARQHHLVK